MERINLIIKFNNHFLCEKIHNEIDFIHVPHYFDEEAFSNISIFITLLHHGLLDSNYHSKISLPYMKWLALFEESFIPDCLFQIKETTFLYDIEETETWKSLENTLPSHLTFITGEENSVLKIPEENFRDEEDSYGYYDSITFINPEILSTIKKLKIPRTNKDVLLMYSGGKDSTLAAIRLVKMGYRVHFIHFDNGHMRDSNKPFLTYQKSFSPHDGYYFPYQFSAVDISKNFNLLFHPWSSTHEGFITSGSIDSEIQCLACRSASI